MLTSFIFIWSENSQISARVGDDSGQAVIVVIVVWLVGYRMAQIITGVDMI